MREKRERIIKPFTNKFGQVIEPGMSVFVVTTCTHQTHITKGEYVGYIERDAHGKMEPFVQVLVEYDKAYYVYKDIQERVNWKTFSSNRDCEWRSEKAHRITTLNYNRILRADSSECLR